MIYKHRAKNTSYCKYNTFQKIFSKRTGCVLNILHLNREYPTGDYPMLGDSCRNARHEYPQGFLNIMGVKPSLYSPDANHDVILPE
jgi:hypothetical protein